MDGWRDRMPDKGLLWGAPLLRRLLFERLGWELASVDRKGFHCLAAKNVSSANPSSAGGHYFHLCPLGLPPPVPIAPIVCPPPVALGITCTMRPSSNVYQVHCFGTESALQSLGVIHRTCVLVYQHDRLGITAIRYIRVDLDR